MNNDEQQFENLKRLLALKRHEVPPPGYFNRLSGKILDRLEASELAAESTWWDWFVRRFDARPILACAYGFTISGLLLMGFRLSQVLQADASVENPSQSMGGGWLALGPDPIHTQPNAFLRTRFENPANLVNFSSSVEPVLELSTQPARSGMFQNASYSFAH